MCVHDHPSTELAFSVRTAAFLPPPHPISLSLSLRVCPSLLFLPVVFLRCLFLFLLLFDSTHSPAGSHTCSAFPLRPFSLLPSFTHTHTFVPLHLFRFIRSQAVSADSRIYYCCCRWFLRGTGSIMGNRASTPAAVEPAAPAASETPAKSSPTCKICCACPAERQARDRCTLFKSMDECEVEINAFYKCLLREGFSQAEVDSLRKNTKAM